jgi:hypothetical protein
MSIHSFIHSFVRSFIYSFMHAQAQAAAQDGYDPKRGAVLYSSQQRHAQQKGAMPPTTTTMMMGGSSSHQELTAEGEPLPPDFLGAHAVCGCGCAMVHAVLVCWSTPGAREVALTRQSTNQPTKPTIQLIP